MFLSDYEAVVNLSDSDVCTTCMSWLTFSDNIFYQPNLTSRYVTCLFVHLYKMLHFNYTWMIPPRLWTSVDMRTATLAYENVWAVTWTMSISDLILFMNSNPCTFNSKPYVGEGTVGKWSRKVQRLLSTVQHKSWMSKLKYNTVQYPVAIYQPLPFSLFIHFCIQIKTNKIRMSISSY